MVQSIPTNSITFQPASLLQQLLFSGSSGSLVVTHKGITWSFYLQAGNLFFATHGVEPFDCLERHLRRLGNEVSTLTREVRAQTRSRFESIGQPTASYGAICWLNQAGYLSPAQVGIVLKSIVIEVLESFLLLPQGQHQLLSLPNLPILVSFPLEPLLEQAKTNISKWQQFKSKISSPFQRPYLFMQTREHPYLSSTQKQRLGSLLKGYSFRHLAVLVQQDELKLVKSLFPYIQDGTIFLREPSSPFDQLPRFSDNPESSAPTLSLENTANDSEFLSLETAQKQFKILCIDDSSAMLQELNRLLADDAFSVTTINDSVKALMEVIRIQPDLILLDVGMPGIDGYKFCRVIRNHAQFKKTPIIMVTGNTGLIDRAKAKLVGATDYMTKPFTQSELLKMVFQYLS